LGAGFRDDQEHGDPQSENYWRMTRWRCKRWRRSAGAHPSQLYEALLEGLLLFVTCYAIWAVVAEGWHGQRGVFDAVSVVRIIGEQFRVGA